MEKLPIIGKQKPAPFKRQSAMEQVSDNKVERTGMTKSCINLVRKWENKFGKWCSVFG